MAAAGRAARASVARRVAGQLLRAPGPASHVLTRQAIGACDNPDCGGACNASLPVGVGLPALCSECGGLLVAYLYPVDGVVALGCPFCKSNVGEMQLPGEVVH